MMNPDQQTSAVQPKKMSGRTKIALLALIAPTVLIIIGFIGYAIVNVLFGISIPDQDPAMNPSPTTTPVFVIIFNVLFFIITATGILTWLPGIITGIVLLATKKPTAPQA